MRNAIVVCLLVGLALAGTGAGWAKSEVGVVDWDKVLASFTAYQAALKQHEDFTAQRQAQLTFRFQTRMLGDAEIKECEELRKLAAPTEEQKKRLQELLAVSDTREQELESLKANASPTPEQSKRIQELQPVSDAGTKALEELRAKLKQEVADEFNRLMTPLDERLKKAIAVVAGELKLGVVLNKGDVLFGGEDITEKVLVKVNAK